MYDAYDHMLIFTWLLDICQKLKISTISYLQSHFQQCLLKSKNFSLLWLTGPWRPNKKSNVNNEDELEVQIMDELMPLETQNSDTVLNVH